MAIERRRLFFSGQVQGVGFRMITRRLASGRSIRGFVRNLDDGRVELLVEGEPEAIIALVEAILGEFGDLIRDTSSSVEPVDDPPLTGFSIR